MNKELIDRYLESDAHVRAGLHASFLSELKNIARDDRSAASEWARRAVSPDLGYTALLGLRKFVLAEDEAREDALRIAVLGGPTTHQLVDLIKIFLAARNVPFSLYEGDYGLFRQEILTPGSGLDRFAPRIVFLATGARDVATVPPISADTSEVERLADEELSGWLNLWRTVHDRWGASVIQNTFEIAPWPAMGHYSLRHRASRENYLDRLNLAFADQAPPYVALHDLRPLVSAAGAREWFDSRFYLEAKMPCGPECLVGYAHSAASLALAIAGKSRKVLVLDLDNTVWGGVVGDAGVEGIVLGQGSGQGEAFLQFQAYAKELHDRGVVLAVCSKNDDVNARRPFELHSEMILKLEHISCFMANWNNKADNLRETARRLALGTDSLVFVDDNPAERAVVRRFLPEVAVPDMPEDPALYVPALAKHRYFEMISWTQEDAARGRYYAENAARSQMAAQFHDLDSFLESLDMTAKIEPVNPRNLERVAQLVNKSNQFNLTTRRRTIAEIEKIANDPDWFTLTLSLKDRLGDNGLVSIVFLRREGGELEVDTWLMSCRVLQRTVEQQVLNEIVAIAEIQGCRSVKGVYIPTERNGMVRDHYSKLGFEPDGTDGAATMWSLSVRSYRPIRTFIRTEGSDNYGEHQRALAAGSAAGV